MDSATLERLLSDVFARIDQTIEVRVHGPSPRPGRFQATIQSAETEVAWLSTAWPKQVRDLLDKAQLPGLVAAAEISPGARKLLTEHGVSWVDETGAARVALPSVYIRVDVGEAPKRPRAQLGWTPATLAVCEALITGVGGTVSEVCSATRLAQSTVGTSLRFLQETHLLESDAARGPNSRRTVVDLDQLLDAYSSAAMRLRSPESIRVGALWRDPVQGAGDFGRRLDSIGVAWSVTGALGAEMLAPYLTEVDPWEVYLDVGSRAGLRQVAREVGLSESGGGRLLLRPFPTPARDLLSTKLGALKVVAWPRVFSDLRTIGVRGEEAAEHLRERMEGTR